MISRVLFSEDTKWNLPVIIKPEGNFCLSIHIVAITRQCYLNFHIGMKFRDDLYSRISIFAVFLQSRKTRNWRPTKFSTNKEHLTGKEIERRDLILAPLNPLMLGSNLPLVYISRTESNSSTKTIASIIGLLPRRYIFQCSCIPFSFTFPLFSCSKRTIYSATYKAYVSLSRLCSAANFWAPFCGRTNVEHFFVFLRSNFGAKYRFRSHIKHQKVNRENGPLLLKCLSTFWHIRRPRKAIISL